MDNGAGALVRKLRTQRRWSQAKLAEKSGVGLATLERWEKGCVTPRRDGFALVLAALGVPHTEQDAALALLKPPEAAQKRNETLEQVSAGNFLRGLRLRRDWTQAEAARQLGVAKSTVMRWERGAIPDEERLPHICTHYRAEPEEQAALACRTSWLTPLLEEGDMTLEVCEERLTRMTEAMRCSQAFAGEPGFHLLEARLLKLAETDRNALRLLGRAWTFHADYLIWRRRQSEAFAYARRAIKITRSLSSPENFWYDAFSIYIVCRANSEQDDLQKVYDRLRREEELAQRLKVESCYARDLAGIAMRMGRIDEAHHHLNHARRIGQRRELAGAIRLANTEQACLYIDAGHPEKALRHLAQDDKFDPNRHFTEIRQWVRALRALRDTSGVAEWIGKGDALLAAHDLEFRRADWERLKRAG